MLNEDDSKAYCFETRKAQNEKIYNFNVKNSKSQVYVGMDVHKESFSLCAYTIEAEKASHYQRTESDYKKVPNYLE